MRKLHYLKDAPYCEDTHLLEVGPEVEYGLSSLLVLVEALVRGSHQEVQGHLEAGPAWSL